MLGKLNPDEIEELLRTQFVGRIGCSADGLVYIVPISYAYEDGWVYCHSAQGRKLDMMRKNPKVCFEVDDLRDMANWKSVVAQGVFEELHERAPIHHCVRVLTGRYLPVISSETMHLGRLWPFEPDDESEIEGVFFRICLGERSGRFESDSQSPLIVG
ncbi:pyridoxamine 5'-phosphate oxidase family protein [Flaviaesturariibacter flavus]|uniref:Pyridoxamine 5'-phosphate oxidase family protein n=1 Tax=Flaviaesturariibacter flavus TaxID=2502780 RepID=A0A4R1BP54_9BACT|nr:pyridoxamine 5'-phosphate oxidase family protein [Flaviaesturariibacter flavus]TCJ19087.1 pyridoxamine 5'-phosphate oxidase family protein [Flaviaesturariibacter flavus]